jgi:hypothetical protein
MKDETYAGIEYVNKTTTNKNNLYNVEISLTKPDVIEKFSGNEAIIIIDGETGVTSIINCKASTYIKLKEIFYITELKSIKNMFSINENTDKLRKLIELDKVYIEKKLDILKETLNLN